MHPLVEVKNVSKFYMGKKILDNISFNIDYGKIITIIGPNGGGKSTLAKIILKLIVADSGFIKYSDKLRIGYMPQNMYIDKTLPMNVRSFLLLGKNNSKKMFELIEEVGIDYLLDLQMSIISGGELQRVMLVWSLLNDPQLLILDEPIQKVDLTGQAEFYQLITKIRMERNISILMISHDLHMVMKSTDKVLCLNHHICCYGNPEDVSNNPLYQNLFGKEISDTMTIYTHNHDHIHNISEN